MRRTRGEGLEVAVPEEERPHCAHGPTLLLRDARGSSVYVCACCRGAGGCGTRLTPQQWADPRVRERHLARARSARTLDAAVAPRLHSIKRASPNERSYCFTCNELYLPEQHERHANHRSLSPLTDSHLAAPSSWLPTLEEDKVQAQYLFATHAVDTILNIVKNNHISNVLCIGTPSIHESIQQEGAMSSLLLDYDSRHHQFWPEGKFLWYNMFNHHFFNGADDEEIFQEFLKRSGSSGLCVVMDPPFGGRVEALACTLRTISEQYNEVRQLATRVVLSVVWVFPYFSEPYICNLLPDIKMHDYQIQYRNHRKFNKSRKPNQLGSPVRLFTNLPLSTVDLSVDPQYKLCHDCKKYVAITNQHCDKCDACTGKNGATYVHCDLCKRCVKPTFFHCVECRRCCQKKDHICGVVLPMSQSCYNCNEKGHKRADCPLLNKNQGYSTQPGVKKRKGSPGKAKTKVAIVS